MRQQECREQGGGGSTLQGAGLAVLRRQYKHEALVYNCNGIGFLSACQRN
jgi:hypothetical protein